MTHHTSKKPLICEINTRPSGSIVDSENQGKKIFTKLIKNFVKQLNIMFAKSFQISKLNLSQQSKIIIIAEMRSIMKEII